MCINETAKSIILAHFNLQIEDKLSVKEKMAGLKVSVIRGSTHPLYIHSMSLCEAKSVFHHTALNCATLKNIPICYVCAVYSSR